MSDADILSVLAVDVGAERPTVSYSTPLADCFPRWTGPTH
jgi:hypothetical protein